MILTALHKLAAQDNRYTPRETAYLGGYENVFNTPQGINYVSDSEKSRNDQAAVKRAFRDKDIMAFDAALSHIFAPKNDLSTVPHELYQFFPSLFNEGAEKFLDKFIENIEQHPEAEELKREFLFHKPFLDRTYVYDFASKLISTGNTAGLQRFIGIAKTLSNGDDEVCMLLTTSMDRYNRQPDVKQYGCLERAMKSQQPEMVTFLIETTKAYSTEKENIAQDMLLHHADSLVYSSIPYDGDKPETLDAIIAHEDLLPEDKRPSTVLLNDLKSQLVSFAGHGKVNCVVWLRDFINQHAENPQGALKTLLDENIEHLLEGLDGSHVRDWEYSGLLEYETQQAVINALLTLSEGFAGIRTKILKNIPAERLAQAYFIEQDTPLAKAQENNPVADKIWQDKLEDFGGLYDLTSSMFTDDNAEAIDKIFDLAKKHGKLDEWVEYCVNKEGPKVLHSIVFALKIHEYGYTDHAKSLTSRSDFGNFHQAISTRHSNADENFSKKVDLFLSAAQQMGGNEYAKEMLFSRGGNALRNTRLAIHEIHSWHDYSPDKKHRRHKSVRTSMSTLIGKANDLDGVEGVRRLLLGSKLYYLKWDTHVRTEQIDKLRKELNEKDDDPRLLEPDLQFLKDLQNWHTDVAMDLLAPYFSALTYDEFRTIFTEDKPGDHSAYKDLATGSRIRDLRHHFGLISKDKREALLEDTSKYFDRLLRTLLENHDRIFPSKKEERLFYKRLYIEHGKGNERWENLTGGKAPHPSLMDYSPVGFYGAKVKLYNHLLPFMKTATKLEKNDGAEANAFKFSVLFRNAQQVEQYLDRYAKRWNVGGGKQIVHDAAQFDLPTHGTWDHKKWGDFVAQYGPEASKFLSRAVRIERFLKDNGKPFPSTPKKMEIISAQVSYKNAHLNIEFAKLAQKYNIGENGFNRAIRILEKAEKYNQIPDVLIDGADIGHPDYYMEKLESGSPLGLVLGQMMPPCCQYVGSAGERAAEHGTTSRYGGFYVWQKKTDGEITPNDKYIAQSWTWIGKDGALVLDSFERVNQKHNALARPFMEQLAYEVSGEHKFTVKNDKNVNETRTVSGVKLGGAGDTPRDLFENISSQLSEPIDTTAYDAKSMQYEIEPVDHTIELSHGSELEEETSLAL